MAHLVMTIQIDSDPAVADPEEVADFIAETYNDFARFNQRPMALLLKAHWENP